MTALEPVSGVATAVPRRRFLPEVTDEPHVIWSSESVPMALQRVTTTHFTTAIDALADPERELGQAVDVADRALGRIVAVLRLVRTSIGTETCAVELAILDEARRFLGGLLVGQAEIRSLDEIRARYDAALRPDALSDLRDQLLHRHQLIRLEQLPAVQQGGSVQHWLQQLRRGRARFAAWPVDEAMHGQDPVPDSFEAFASGLQRTYRKGRKRARAATVDAARWERSARDLAHQIELLSGAWPDVMAGTVATAVDLADVLAECQRVSALRAAVSPRPGDMFVPVTVDDVTRSVVESLCDHEHQELLAVARVLATRLYAESPSDFTDRMARYWSTRG